jgi:hypothetical protein
MYYTGIDLHKIRCGYYNLKIPPSIMDSALCGLHNDKYTKFQPCNNCVFRASSIPFTEA